MTAPELIAAERKDAVLSALAVVIRTLTDASKERPGEAGEALLEAAETLVHAGDRLAELLAAKALATARPLGKIDRSGNFTPWRDQ